MVDADGTFGDEFYPEPSEVAHLLNSRNRLLINLPKTYPDPSLPWMIASDLLVREIDGRQPLPIVINGKGISRPSNGLREQVCPEVQPALDETGAVPVYIIENLPLQSETRLKFLLEQMGREKGAKFVFVERETAHLVEFSEFSRSAEAGLYEPTAVSFEQIAAFLQASFSIQVSEAEVIAYRLHQTFSKFELDVHPTYFAGLSRETVTALLQANRRGELLELAVDGIMLFIVAGDRADVALSKTTKSKFLENLAYSINVEKRSFSEEDLISQVKELDDEYDFDIKPIEFINSFIEKGVLHFVSGKVRFSLPFVERVLLAKRLSLDETSALQYFSLSEDFDLGTFDLYSEKGPHQAFVARAQGAVEQALADLKPYAGSRHVLIGDELKPALLGKPGKLDQIQSRLRKAVDAVASGKGDIAEKQRLLDYARKVRHNTVKGKKKKKNIESDADTAPSERAQALDRAVLRWVVGTVLLGSGAEHLRRGAKRELAKQIVRLASTIIDVWTRGHASVDFERIRNDYLSDEGLRGLLEDQEEDIDPKELKSTLNTLIDALEYSYLSEPYRRVLNTLCEQARHKALAVSIENVQVQGEMENVIHATWLADIDHNRGKARLKKAITDLPQAAFLRVNLASQLLTRVFWSHWKKEVRLSLLDIALGALRPVKLRLDVGKIQRMINKEEPKPK
jgi:hypothetical protein